MTEHHPRRDPHRDALWYAGFTVVALGVGLVDEAPLARGWGRVAAATYAIGAIASATLGRTMLRRTAITILVFVGAVLLPLGLELWWRVHHDPGSHAKSETVVTEESARALARGENPYETDYSDGPLARFPAGVDTHVPYLPGNLAFGFTRILFGSGVAGDARLVFAAVFLGTTIAALRLSRASSGVQLRAFMVVVVSPLGARFVVGGGNDLPVIGAMLLALVLLERRRTGTAGLAEGLAATVKLTAWPLLPFLIAAARGPSESRDPARDPRDPARRRTATIAVAAVIIVVVPFLLWDPAAMIQDVLLYPLGLTTGGTPAASPTLGGLLARWFPEARGAIAAGGGAVVGALALWILATRPPGSAREAARAAALVLLVATVLATAGRFGYLVYALDLWLWSVWILPPEPKQPQRARIHRRRSRPSPIMGRRGWTAR